MSVSAENVGQAADAIEKLVKLLTFPARAAGKYVNDEFVSTFRSGFQEFLTTSFNRCRYYKTVLSKSPVSVLSNYTNLNLKIGKNVITDKKLSTLLADGSNIVVTGTAGGGKSMLLKRIFLEFFYGDYGVMPIFLELRRLNEFPNGKLLEVIRENCLPQSSSITLDQFKKTLKKNKFLFILDGFDEISKDIRPDVSADILSLKKDFPQIVVVVSSRYNDVFRSWTNFHECEVLRLNKNQCLDIISKLNVDDDDGARGRFYKRVEEDLYESHSTFLSTPLLITIMLFTFERSGIIPEQMHEFYSRAYDALFERHDVMKEQFVRKKLTNLDKYQFSLCFSAFCALSYQHQQYEFDDASLRNYCARSIKYANSCEIHEPALTVDNFIKDLIESVCLIQAEGDYYFFVHRSFQEYFTAVFLSELPDEYCFKFFEEMLGRPQDSVINLFSGIDREKFQRVWALPKTVEMKNYFESASPLWKKIFAITAEVYFEIMPEDSERVAAAYILGSDDKQYQSALDVLHSAYRSDITELYNSFSERYVSDDGIYDRLEVILKNNKNYPKDVQNFLSVNLPLGEQSEPADISIIPDRDSDKLLKMLGYGDVISHIVESLIKIEEEVSSSNARKKTFLDGIM